ncbi:hypothetical protein C3486_05345 [Streptomyces sp. Ru73]|nr:hypothetical protein C3486_05345 [Streptomyces sp. Ru73]
MAAGVFVLTGCMLPSTSGSRYTAHRATPSHSATPSTEAPSPSATPEPSATEAGAEGDVKIDSCAVDPLTGWPAAKVTITNRTDQESNYMATIEFVEADGTRVGTGLAAENNLKAGQKARTTAQGLQKAGTGMRCKIASVTRYPSP